MPRTPAFLLRLMRYEPIRGRVKLGPEDLLCIEFANILREKTLTGDLRAVWSHPANELCYGHKTGVKAAIARAMGMHIGTPDYLFLSPWGSLALEAKSKRGTQTRNQKDFEQWCLQIGVPYKIFRTVDEGLDALRGAGMVSK